MYTPLLLTILLSLIHTTTADTRIANLTGQVSLWLSSTECYQPPVGPDVWVYLDGNGGDCAANTDGSWNIPGSLTLTCERPSDFTSPWIVTMYSDSECRSSAIATVTGTGKGCVPIGSAAQGGAQLNDNNGNPVSLSNAGLYANCEIYSSDRTINA